MKVMVETSAHHVHVSEADLEALFGKGAALTNKKDLSQPGQFACEEKVEVVGPKGTMKMSILGPTRPETQVEISLTDARKLDTLIFLMFLIPGTPKDTLNYLCPLTSISPVRFLVLSTFARIPSVISSTFAGANFAEGNLLASVIVLGITSAVGLLGIRYEHVLTDHLNRSAARFRERMNSGKHQ